MENFKNIIELIDFLKTQKYEVGILFESDYQCINIATILKKLGEDVYNFDVIMKLGKKDYNRFYYDEDNKFFVRQKSIRQKDITYTEFMKIADINVKYRKLENLYNDPYNEDDWGWEEITESFYSALLEKATTLELGDWLFIKKDEEYPDCENRLCQVITVPKSRGYYQGYNIKFVEPINMFKPTNTRWLYDTKHLTFDLVKMEKEKLENHVVFPLIKSEAINIIFKEINFPITNFFLDWSYFDTTKKNDMVSYLPVKKGEIAKTKEWKSPVRQKTRISRVLKKLNPSLTEKQIQDYANQFKARYEKLINNIDNNLRVVTGEEIRYWYLEDHYAEGGMLNNSCMRYPESQKRFGIYVNHPSKIGMLILTNDDEKLLGRAIIWNVDDPKLIFMDRVYAINDFYQNVLINYGKERGMKYYFTDSETKMTINDIETSDCSCDNPFMDTFRYYNVDKKQLLSFEPMFDGDAEDVDFDDDEGEYRRKSEDGDEIVEFSDHD
jgi:hypothetical protein